MTKLHELYETGGQSPWIDNLKRSYLTGGQLARLAGEGIRGVTSNPTIFAKAIEGQDDYDEQFASLIKTGTVGDAYWELVIQDIGGALDVFRPLYDESNGGDGFVSLEVSPALARDTAATLASARSLHERIAESNLLVKVPATAEGVPAIRQLIGEGRSINVTLIFGLERYDAVVEAYIGGLEDYLASGATDLSNVHSVASFFVSRVDTEIDRRLEQLAGGGDGGGGDQAILALRGQAAVAQAQEAYQHFGQAFSGPRWEALAAKGAHVQRPLWASTSTKNPAYPDLLYVDTLIGPDTVNTMPAQTIDAVLDHATIARTIDADPAGAASRLARLADAGIDFADVSATLEDEGVHSFAKSFDDLLQILTDKASSLS